MVELREPLDDLIAPPARFTSGTKFPRAKEIRLYDTTLRDGEQTPGVAFTPEQKFEMACMLSDAGVHIIDMGFPSAAPSERRALELILQGKKKGRIRPDLEIIVMCRSNARDIDITVDTLEQMGMCAADGNPMSMMWTPASESMPASSYFWSGVKATPGVCSPSRSVVS